jgi:type I restriction enzyme R subunit
MAELTPEQQARVEIDRQLEQCGWTVQSREAMNITAALGVAVREFPLATGHVDYMLYADGRAICTVEAKPAGHSLIAAEPQSSKYITGLPSDIPNWANPLPFHYESTGEETQFTNRLEPASRSREVFTFHRPDELIRQVKLGTSEQLRTKLKKLPPLQTVKLWKVQVEAIANLEKSLAQNHPRALIQMATGSGKTFTACAFVYRLIKFAKAKRVLFLVDRNNLGKQALNEFQQFDSPHTAYKFTEEYPVQHLRKNSIDPAGKVVITTIQRLYSILKGEPQFEEEAEEKSMFESSSPLYSEPLPVVYNPAVPIETFDFIVIDECHRSIYNVWRQVLEYFDAFLIGLTATPTPQTLGFFRQNQVQDYGHEKAVADGVNVGYDVYRIKTKVSGGGAKLAAEPGLFVPRRDRRTRKKRLAELEDDLTYTASQLDRDVVNEAQIRLVIRTFKERLFTEIFPGRTEVPKTLVFAKTDLHADDIVRVIREEFNKGNDWCVKITSKTTGKSPDDLLNEFRNSYNPRIAVTVDMIATGTDVKPLECLLFMRNIRSASYFEQMKGRGVRIIGTDDIQAVTPDTDHKSRFVIVDAVGVCEQDKTNSKPLDRKPSVSFEKLMDTVAKGVVHPDVVSTLAARLARLHQETTAEQEAEIAKAARGVALPKLAADLLDSVDPDRNAAKAREMFHVAECDEPLQKQLNDAERESMREALIPFHNPDLRKLLIAIKQSLEQVVDEITPDKLLTAGFDKAAKEKAQAQLAGFRQFLEDNRDEIEAIQILYSRPYRAGLRYRQVKELAQKIEMPPLAIHHPEQQLWAMYEALEPEKVKGHGGNALVDLVAIVKHALHPEEPLIPVTMSVEERYREWLLQQESAGVSFTVEQRRWLDAIKDHIASSLHIEADDFDYAPFTQLGGLGKAHQLFGERLDEILKELNARLAA